MTARLHLLLAAACVLALLQIALGKKCTFINYGTTAGNRQYFDDAIFPGELSTEVELDTTCPKINGVYAKICDYDVTPTANFVKPLVILVQRNGDVLDVCDIKVTLYCGDYRLK